MRPLKEDRGRTVIGRALDDLLPRRCLFLVGAPAAVLPEARSVVCPPQQAAAHSRARKVSPVQALRWVSAGPGVRPLASAPGHEACR